jgi:sulfate adenylyltransferase subunit 1 (EFTu-like GTPase family)
MNVAVELDTDVFAERGFWISGQDSPPKLTRVFDAEIFWHGPAPLSVGTTLRLAIATSAVDVRVQAIRWALDADGMSHVQSAEIAPSGIGGITVRAETLSRSMISPPCPRRSFCHNRRIRDDRVG